MENDQTKTTIAFTIRLCLSPPSTMTRRSGLHLCSQLMTINRKGRKRTLPGHDLSRHQALSSISFPSNASIMMLSHTTSARLHFGPHAFLTLHQLFSSLTDDNVSHSSNELDAEASSIDIGVGDPSLNSSIHYILSHRIRVGQMNSVELQKARSFLSITSKWKNVQGAKLAEALLERIYKERTDGHNNYAIVDTEMYNICMNAWNSSGADGREIVENVESLMDRMEKRLFNHSHVHSGMARPDRTSYNCLINAYSKWQEYSSSRMEAILEMMNRIADESLSSDELDEREYAQKIRPDEFTYNSIMNYYATRNQHFAAQQAEDTLLRMSGLTQQTGSTMQLSSTSFNIVMKAWSNSGGGLAGAERARSLLQLMIKLHNQGHQNVQPTALSFSTAINAYSKVDSKDATTAVEAAMELLDILEGTAIPDPENVNSCYNTAANVVGKSKMENAGMKVMELIERMKNMDAFPDERIYVSCIHAFANEGSEESFEKASNLITEMTARLQCNPTSVAYNVLLHALVNKNSLESMELAEDLMSKMEIMGGNSRPDSASYSIMIRALSRSTFEGSDRKAVDYLRCMLRSYNNDHYCKAKPNSYVFNCVISMIGRSKQDWADEVIYKTLISMVNQTINGNTLVVPDTVTYNTVIGKLSKNPTKGNTKKIIKLLKDMENMEKTGNSDAAPDIITYTNVLRIPMLDTNSAATIASTYFQRLLANESLPQIDRIGLRTVMIALSRSSHFEHAQIVRRMWDRLEDSAKTLDLLDSELCNLVLLSFKKSNTAQSAEESLYFLTTRIQRFTDGDKSVILPTVVGMNAALTCISNSGRIKDSLILIDMMKALSDAGVPGIKPDVGCYTAILTSLSGSQTKYENNALCAEKVLNKMEEDFEVIPIAAINAAINACAWTSGDATLKLKAIQICFHCFDRSREAVSYDATTFGLMIKACMKLTSDDETRFKLVQRLFRLCAKNGLVGEMVMREIGHFKPRLLPDGRVLPEWTVNAVDRFQRT